MPETHSSLLRDGSFADNEILSTALGLREAHPEREIVLVSKDINLRIKAAILGVPAEDYYNDRALDDLSLLYRGLREHDEGFWEANPSLESWTEGGRARYRIPFGEGNGWYPNQCVAIGEGAGGLEAVTLDGAITCYCTTQPCVVCAKMLINANVKRIVYEGDYPDELSRQMLEEANQ